MCTTNIFTGWELNKHIHPVGVKQTFTGWDKRTRNALCVRSYGSVTLFDPVHTLFQ